MPNSHEKKLEGLAFNVYMYVAKQRKPLGPREVMHGLSLSSPSVAHRHLQNLESDGLLTRNQYGEYILKKKAKVGGFFWVGRKLLPRTMIYCFFFALLLFLEVFVLAIHWQWETDVVKTYYAIGMTITGIAIAAFLLESIMAVKKLNKQAGNGRLNL
jgi:hypothetical protein